MKVLKTRIRGFQCFADTDDIGFAAGINLIIGQNNSGKSALLRALRVELADDRHRTPERWQEFELPASEVDLTVEVTGDEVRQWALRSRGEVWIPIQTPQNHAALPQAASAFVADFFKRQSIQVTVRRTSNNNNFGNYQVDVPRLMG